MIRRIIIKSNVEILENDEANGPTYEKWVNDSRNPILSTITGSYMKANRPT